MAASGLRNGHITTSQQHKIDITTGWSALAKTVREIDEEKVRDCKEDVDTLLVFAGLFSAVMTAFIIESYKDLQEDSGTMIVHILMQMATHSNNSMLGFDDISSSDMQPIIPAFTPPPSAIRVNVLWFASLIFSLTTASLGMLVKQWLREFLAGKYIGPRARLRVRHFRHPGLAQWRVFEIAAFLPLLLQLALGLFFLGLCFFTSAVHPSIGHTSIPLVCGWVFFLLSATIAPLFSPRCPYKTALLTDLMRFLRPRCYRAASGIKRYAYRMVRFPSYIVASVIRSSPSIPPNISDSVHISNPRLYGPAEEDLIANAMIWDTEILLTMDAVLLDDDILNTSIWDSFMETPHSQPDTISFALAIVAHRVEGLSPSSLPSDLRTLAPRTWDRLSDAVIDTLRRAVESDTGPIYFNTWMQRGLLLLLSLSSSSNWKKSVTSISDIIKLFFARNRSATCFVLASAPCISDPDAWDEGLAAEYLGKIGEVLVLQHEGEATFGIFEEILGRCIRKQAYDISGFKISEFFSSPWYQSMNPENLQHVACVVAALLQDSVKTLESTSNWSPWMGEAADFVVQCILEMGDPIEDWSAVGFSYNLLAGEFVALLADERERRLMRAYLYTLYAHDGALAGALNNVCRSIESRQRTIYTPIRLCHIVLLMIKLPDADAYPNQWRQVLSQLGTLFEDSQASSSTEDLELAEKCMKLVHALECHNITTFSSRFAIPGPLDLRDPAGEGYFPLDDERWYQSWLRHFDPDKSLFPENFILALSRIARKETRWYRVRRLREMGYHIPPL